MPPAARPRKLPAFLPPDPCLEPLCLQGLFAPCAEGDAGFSPLASGLGAPSFAAGSCTAAAQHKQRRQLRQAAAWRLASSKQQAEAGRPRGSLDAGMGAAAAAAVSHGTLPCHPPPGSISSSLQWEPAAHMGHATQPFTFLAQPRQQQTHLKQRHEPCALAPPAPAAAPPVPHVPQQQQQLLGAPHHQQERPQAPLPQWSAGSYAPASRPPSQQVMSRLGPQRCSTGQDMETDLRQSWDSERSADVRPWQTLQARLREEASGPAAAALQQRQASMASEGDAAMRASGDGLPSARSSLDAPSCSVERQTSQLPLRSAMRGEPWHSHLPSPPGDDASPDPLLGRSTGSGRQRRRGSNSVRGGAV